MTRRWQSIIRLALAAGVTVAFMTLAQGQAAEQFQRAVNYTYRIPIPLIAGDS